MRIPVAIAIVLFLVGGIFVADAFAAGGGGGGGGGSSGGSSGGGGAGLSSVACLDTGSVRFTLNPVQRFNFTRLSDHFVFEAAGEWTGNDFASEEVVFTEAGEYTISTEHGLQKNFTCPPFHFSCRVVQLNATSCVKNESGVFAEFYMLNDDVPENLKLSFRVGDRILKHSSTSKSTELSSLTVTKITPTRYQVRVSAIDPEEFEVLHELCIGKNYVYSRIPCTENASPAAGKDLKCGGYLSIEDRVTCRLNLREEQRGEYENFFPEECKSPSVNPEKCLDVYKKVQKCWAFENGPERISCVKNEIGLGELIRDKSSCDRFSGHERGQCIREFNEKVYTLVKFRLYNLEEEGERLVEDGVLAKEDLRNFVVHVELKKQEFNSASSKEGKRKVILDVKELWKDLLSKRRPE